MIIFGYLNVLGGTRKTWKGQ